ncbi:tubulin epsilon and delta complex protein 1 isoform X6 [Leopardus geoffroyi]|uniref:tubulin epsilon and delta complex protein 1 isoform X6 n=1 Tax=Leopardus geoffroyi TaxID=46844 RepID=UPI001E26514F|nr:tubulin epsilon and delta complex protein 1 isoform X6 [Leopardus geoffroyi]
MPAHWTEETALKGRGHRSLGRRWRRVSTRSVIGRGPSRAGTGAVIGRWDPAAAARNPRKVSASCMGRRRRRVDRGAAVGALPEAIAALSRTLPAGPSPEIFRRAKFDRPEAAPALWQLLFRVLSPLSANGASAPPAQEAQVRVVKSELRSQGYPRRALAQLPEDGSQGSRELLLALAWLLARGPLLERLLAQTRVRLGDEIPLCECEALARPGPPVPRVEADGPVDIRHLQWLMGKLRFQWRKLITSQQEQCALLGKIHSYTRGCHSDRSLGHLSVAETELLRDAESGQQVRAAASEAGERECAPGGSPALEAPGAGLLAVDGHSPGHLPSRGLAAHVCAADPRAGGWRVGAGGPRAADPTGGVAGSRGAPAGGLGGQGWRLGARVECGAAGLTGGRGTRAGSSSAGLGARWGRSPAPRALPAGEERRRSLGGPRPAGGPGD